jgi:CMP-N-acetylneuraminic acid synthetase
MNIGAVVFLRAESKGLPEKNLTKLSKIEFDYHSFQFAIRSSLEDVTVDTDSLKIAAERFGARKPLPTLSLVQDDANAEAALKHSRNSW